MSEPTTVEKPITSEQEETESGVSDPILSPAEADAKAQAEFEKKYGPDKKVSQFAKRKLGQSKGRVYFDSGEYNQTKSSSSKAEIQARPRLPMMEKVKKTSVPSKLAQ